MVDLSREYGEGGGPIPAIPEPTVIFIINGSLRHGSMADPDVYRATRCSWVIGNRAREQAVYALGVSHGVVRGAYRIDNWIPAEGNRWCFDGRAAPELKVVGASVARIRPRQGDRRAVRLYLQGIPEAHSDDHE